jgi:hypothetical protein
MRWGWGDTAPTTPGCPSLPRSSMVKSSAAPGCAIEYKVRRVDTATHLIYKAIDFSNDGDYKAAVALLTRPIR